MSINGEKIRKELSEGIPQIPLEDLRTLQSDYPYFQAIRFLYLKRIQKEEPLLYPEAIERNAIYSGDRKSLFFLLEGARQSWTSLYRQNIESEKSKESFSLIDSFLSAQNENFSESIEQLIFQTGGIPATDYLSLSKTESGNDTSNLNELQNIDLINSFIEKSEKGNPLVTDIDATIKPENTKNIPETPLTESTDEAFLTESLAKIYIKQRRYSKALEIIKKLFITILILIASIFLILIVLVQNSKGGGLASGFSSTNQIMGVRKTTDFVEKATWTLAGTVVILSIVASAFLPSANTGSHGSEIKDAIKKEIPATAQPGFETQQTTAPIAQPDSAK